MSSRRIKSSTDESGVSMSSSAAADARLGFVYLDATALEDESSETILRRSLTLRSVISTTSSFAQRLQEAASRPELQVFREIGEGLQGIIFEQIGRPLVLKKEKPENTLSRGLDEEYAAHQSVYSAFKQFRVSIGCNVSVPAPREFISGSDDQDWILSKLPEELQYKSDMFEMERVLPLPKIIRRALIEKFYPFSANTLEHQKTATVQDQLNFTANKDCLIRPYLGKRTKNHTPAEFSLRNFAMGLTDLEELGFDFKGLAMDLGKAYAVLQWGAYVNGDDIEFVLGSAVTTRPGVRGPNFQHRRIGLYLIDFGQCDRVDMDNTPDEVYYAFKAGLIQGTNQDFIPSHEHSPELFQIFKDAYSAAAKTVLARDTELQGKFDIDEFMEQYQEYAEDLLTGRSW